jgi:hypothetical protein
MQLVMEMMRRCCARYDFVLCLRQRYKAQHYTPVCGTTNWQVGHTVVQIQNLAIIKGVDVVWHRQT